MRVKVYRQKGYTVMSNEHLLDGKLSLKAKGLLSLMLALPDTWKYHRKGLAALTNDGTTAIENAIKELIDCGYVIRERERDSKGRLKGAIYHVFETKREVDQLTIFPMLENPTQENPTQDDTLLLYKKKIRNKEIKSAPHFANERVYTKEDFEAIYTNVEDIDI